MILLHVLQTLLLLGLEQVLQWRFGAMGLIGLVLLGFGLHLRRSKWICLSAVLFVLLMVQG
ncbi:hypothetical protein ACIQNU_33640 [Streptomyces sp. NPDC091292]|uniref:hypothetical protein n=1 Tax=Streptomyces sp. NPDC091292 TaxID=3365991 RepID=UPI00381BAEB6